MAIKRVGVDIGGTHVRVAEVEFSGKGAAARGRGTLTGYAEVPLPRGAVQAGEVVDVSGVGNAIRQAAQDAVISVKDAHVGVGSANVVVREIELPALPMPQLKSSLPFHVQETLPMSVDEVLLDFYPTGEKELESSKVVRGIMVAAPKSTVTQNLLAVEAAGLRPKMVDLAGFALLRSQYTEDVMAGGVAFVDIGARLTTVVITSHGVPRLVRTLPQGGQDLTDAVAGSLQISAVEAEEVKIQMGLGGRAVPGREAAIDPLAQSARALVEGVRNTFVYFASSNPGEAPAHVVMTGGGSLLNGLGQYLASATRLPVRYGNAFARVALGKKVRPEVVQGLEVRAAVPIGLAFGEAS
ncbi:cell division protein FtsA [Demequina sediminis]|uniref:Cell division protein FtsA n=1 Tax=Demequina sediminis TaxID=1930058 RepID=A0ABP9WGG1_9MICO|nr:type IV pilus assembly protein PilM [Demequina sediminis]BDZ60962.1 pilus assembly protein PilM [Demequina sediminis]